MASLVSRTISRSRADGEQVLVSNHTQYTKQITCYHGYLHSPVMQFLQTSRTHLRRSFHHNSWHCNPCLHYREHQAHAGEVTAVGLLSWWVVANGSTPGALSDGTVARVL